MAINRNKFILRLALLFFSYLTLAISPSTYSQDFIKPIEAQNHIGSVKSVCGIVANAKYAVKSRGSPTFLNLDRPYPNHIFTIVIWGNNRYKFDDAPEVYFNHKEVCVTGLISSYRGIPQIVVDKPKQIKINDQ